MSAKTNFLSNKILNHFLRNTADTAPTTVYLALYTVAPTATTGGTEVTGASYARQAMTFAAASGGACSTSADITFSGLPAGTVVAVAICDASTSGNILWFKSYGPTTLNLNDQLKFISGNVTVTES